MFYPWSSKKLRWNCCCSHGSSSPAAIPAPVERTRPEDQSGVGGEVGDWATDLLFWLQLMTGSGLALPKDTFFSPSQEEAFLGCLVYPNCFFEVSAVWGMERYMQGCDITLCAKT